MDYIAKLREMGAKNNFTYPVNDIGVAKLFYEFHSETNRYVAEAKSWYAFDGKRWLKDEGGANTAEMCKLFVQGYHSYFKIVCPEESAEPNDKAMLKFAAGLSSLKRRECVMKDARTIEPLNMAAFDRDPHVINLQNGAFDLRTMTLRPHRSADFITKLARAYYDPKARCPRWERFISEIMCGDADMARYLQKALGYTLSGDMPEHVFFILHGGTTRNGKSTLTETAAHILGDYARTAQAQTIAKRSSDGAAASPDLARLKGARLVNISEPEKGLELNAALLKQLTGGDTYTARFLHENQFEFSPEFTIFINTNHLPRVADDTVFKSNRIKLIPFERHFEPHEQDSRLKSLFRKPQNMSGILNWLVDGYRLYKTEGLSDTPERVSAALEDYRRGNGIIDPIGEFIANTLIPCVGKVVKTSLLYDRYKPWSRECGYNTVRIQDFVSELRSRVTVRHDTSLGNIADGYALKSEHNAIHVSDVSHLSEAAV